jgi:hypothetical protein
MDRLQIMAESNLGIAMREKEPTTPNCPASFELAPLGKWVSG